MTTREDMLTSNDSALADYLRNTRAQLRAQDKGLRRLSRRVQRQADYIAMLEHELDLMEEQAHELGAYVERIDGEVTLDTDPLVLGRYADQTVLHIDDEGGRA